jgi:hypothetical protein
MICNIFEHVVFCNLFRTGVICECSTPCVNARNAAHQLRGLGGVARFVDSLDERGLFFYESIVHVT